ncbi:Uncharacterised protein [Aedoeadaptatus ivorii]|uniref:Uncharacterized protein n=1 Tax=Aedoeadaptatus ivorii TaxID=54006 RepID=A0A3S5BVP8_9FIRM|nr:hypothetical protein [Peptoniphilus ivorii]MDQ0508463.1 hypothetical protein [Peptoniphilus ivorii]VEJ34220.1 Uncharacterised protein [Peptoniphilus ivorii]
MLDLKQGNKEIGVEVLEYEYPPGWGAGMPYQTDYLICRITWDDGAAGGTEEESFFRFGELEAIAEACSAILEGDSFGFEAAIEHPRVFFSVEIEDGFLFPALSLERPGVTVRKKQTPDEFRAMTEAIYDTLRSVARM